MTSVDIGSGGAMETTLALPALKQRRTAYTKSFPWIGESGTESYVVSPPLSDPRLTRHSVEPSSSSQGVVAERLSRIEA